MNTTFKVFVMTNKRIDISFTDFKVHAESFSKVFYARAFASNVLR